MTIRIIALGALLAGTASAAVPLRWTVETSRVQPATFEAYQGETLELEAALQSYGKPLAAPSEYALYWQTNGMGSAWWSVSCASASSPTNVLHAAWSPSMDVGAKVYNCFIGQTGTIFHAAFQLRLRPSPGAIPNELPLPRKVIDFSQVTVLNPPWTGGVDTNAVRDIVAPLLSVVSNRVEDVNAAKRDIRNLNFDVSDNTGPFRIIENDINTCFQVVDRGGFDALTVAAYAGSIGAAVDIAGGVVEISASRTGLDPNYVHLGSENDHPFELTVCGTNVMDAIAGKVGPSEVASIVTNDIVIVGTDWMMDGQPLDTDVWEMTFWNKMWLLVHRQTESPYPPVEGGHSENDLRIVYRIGTQNDIILTRSATYKNALGLAYERDFDKRISATDPTFSNEVSKVSLAAVDHMTRFTYLASKYGTLRFAVRTTDGTPAVTVGVLAKASEGEPLMVDWGDGTIEEIGESITVMKSHAYSSSGTFEVQAVNCGNGTVIPTIYTGPSTYSNLVSVAEIPRSITVLTSEFIRKANSLSVPILEIPSTIVKLSNTPVQSGGSNDYGGQFMESNLEVLEIPDSVQGEIPFVCIRQMPNLKRLTVGSGITSIGNYGISLTPALESLTCRAVLPPVISASHEDNMFTSSGSKTVNATLYVPNGSVEAYRVAVGWRKFANIVGY